MRNPLDDYDLLREKRPEWFDESTEDGAIALVTDREGIAAAGVALDARHPEMRDYNRAFGLIFDSPFFIAIRDAVRFPDGALGGFLRIAAAPQRPDGVAILPVIGEDVVLIREFRHAVRDWRWQIPRGFGEPGETPEQGAARELREELGAEAISTCALGQIEADSGVLAMANTLVVAEVSEFKAMGDATEAISEARRFSPDDINALIKNGELVCGITMAALTMWRSQPG